MCGLGLEEVFSSNGILARNLADYEYRPFQIQMAEAVRNALSQGSHLIVEAGTGTGKTLAYLIPAIDYALESKKRVVVSTGTKNLQDQLMNKDIPFLKKVLPVDFKVVCMKGRVNYLCLHRLRLLCNQPLLQNLDEVDYFKQIERWAEESRTGNFEELAIPERLPFLKQISARSETCLGQQCEHFAECFITKMRKNAENAQIIVVNHHLFFADLMIRENEYGKVIPDYEAVIFDEAHLIEEIATNYFGSQVSTYQIEELLRDVSFLLKLTSAEGNKSIMKAIKEVQNATDELRQKIFQILGKKTRKRILKTDFFSDKVLTPVGGAFVFLVKRLEELEEKLLSSGELDSIPELVTADEEEVEKEILLRRVQQIRLQLGQIFEASKEDLIYWIECKDGNFTLYTSPLDISTLIQEKLFSNSTAILTSATLTSEGSFDYIKRRLGFVGQDCKTLLLGSGFNYQKQAILYLPKKMPEPGSFDYTIRAADEITRILEITRGRAFVLCTSVQSMSELYEVVAEQVKFPCFIQGQLSKTALLEQFRKTENAVLFATSSFWQGVDVKGEQLSCVIIDKLPFAVPTDPIIEARMDFIKEKGGDPFLEYSIPQATILLKQGIGRLIRSKTDKGILVILDPRIRTKSYGIKFIKSLPEMKITSEITDVKTFLEEKLVCEHTTK